MYTHTDDKPWDVVSATRLSSDLAPPRACVRVYVRVLWCRRIFTYIHVPHKKLHPQLPAVCGGALRRGRAFSGAPRPLRPLFARR